jgi:hypothetical protein
MLRSKNPGYNSGAISDTAENSSLNPYTSGYMDGANGLLSSLANDCRLVVGDDGSQEESDENVAFTELLIESV